MASSEVLLVSSVVRSGDVGPVMHAGIEPDMLKVCPNEMGWLLHQQEVLGHVPDQAAFQAQFPSFTLVNTEDVAAHVHAVGQAHAKSRMVRLVDEVLGMLSDGEIDRAITTVSAELVSIQASLTDINDSIDIVTQWAELFDLVEEKVDKVARVGMAGIPTGWKMLDRNTGGFQDGWLVIVGGRLGMGKTWVMIRMACEAVLKGHTALYFSLEQSRHQIGMRAQSVFSHLLSTDPQIKALDMMRGTVESTDDLKTAMKEIEAGVEGKLLVNDTSRGRIGTMQVASAIEQAKPKIVFVDYLTLLSMTGEGDWRSVARLSADLKRLAERYEIPIVCGSQVNRGAREQEMPDAGQLSQADSVGQDADLVVSLARPSTSVLKMALVKNRHGPDGFRWHARFKPGVGDLADISGDEASRLINEDKEVDA